MGWSANFIAHISNGNCSPRFVVEVLHTDGFRPLDYLWMASHDEAGQYAQVITGRGRVSAAILEPGSWSASMAELTLEVVWFADIRNQIARGTMVQVLMGFPGWSVGQFEPIFIGHVQSITRLPGEVWSLAIRSAVASLTSRLTQEQGETSLFHSMPWSTTIATSDYTAGDATLNVGSTASAERETGGSYLLLITPSTGPDPFYLIATGKTGTTFTGCTALGQLGTLAVASVIGDAVQVLAYINDHPVDVVRKVACSTGAGTNGAYDTLPSAWGIGIPDAAWDHDDCEWTKEMASPTGLPNAAWDVYQDAEVDDSLAWINGLIAPAGLFVTMRQGRLSVRAVSTQEQPMAVTALINDADIVSLDRYDTWDPASPVEYSTVTVTTLSGGSASLSLLDSRPAGGDVALDLPYIVGNQPEWRTNILARVAPWFTHVPEVLDITCVGWRLATLAPGDHLTIQSRLWTPRDGFIPGFLLVLAVDPDWFGATTRIRAAYLPFVDEFSLT